MQVNKSHLHNSHLGGKSEGERETLGRKEKLASCLFIGNQYVDGSKVLGGCSCNFKDSAVVLLNFSPIAIDPDVQVEVFLLVKCLHKFLQHLAYLHLSHYFEEIYVYKCYSHRCNCLFHFTLIQRGERKNQ